MDRRAAAEVKYVWRRCPATGGACQRSTARRPRPVPRDDRGPGLPARRARCTLKSKAFPDAVKAEAVTTAVVVAPTPPPGPPPGPAASSAHRPGPRPRPRADAEPGSDAGVVGIAGELPRARGADRRASASRPALLRPFPVVRIRGDFEPGGVRVTLLSVNAPRSAHIAVRCSGRGCPLRSLSIPRAPARLRPFERFLTAGTVLQVRVTQRGAHRQVRELPHPRRLGAAAHRPLPDARQREAGGVLDAMSAAPTSATRSSGRHRGDRGGPVAELRRRRRHHARARGPRPAQRRRPGGRRPASRSPARPQLRARPALFGLAPAVAGSPRRRRAAPAAPREARAARRRRRPRRRALDARRPRRRSLPVPDDAAPPARQARAAAPAAKPRPQPTLSAQPQALSEPDFDETAPGGFDSSG